jgi:hypothetical protein
VAKTKPIPAATSDTSARALQIDDIVAFAVSFPVKDGVTLGIRRAVKRDAVVVRVHTKGGLSATETMTGRVSPNFVIGADIGGIFTDTLCGKAPGVENLVSRDRHRNLGGLRREQLVESSTLTKEHP